MTEVYIKILKVLYQNKKRFDK